MWSLGLVALALAGLAAWPLWDTLTPTARVQVAAVLPAKSLGPEFLGTESRSIASVPALSSQSGAGNNAATLSPVAHRKPTRTVQAAGWVEPDPYLIAVGAEADGIVARIHAMEGGQVEAGQVVAELIDADAKLALLEAQAAVARTEAQLAQAQAEQTAAQTDWDQPIERTRHVTSTQAALAEAQAKLKQWPARIAEAKALALEAKEALTLLKEASKQGAVNDKELLLQRHKADAQQAALDAATAESGVLEAKVNRLEAEALAAQQAAELRVAESQALAVAQAQVKQAEAALQQATAQKDTAQLRLDRMTIHAPIAGNVLRRLKQPGDRVMLGMDDPHASHILHLYDPKRLQVRVDVPLADAAQVVLGQRCEITVETLPDSPFDGQVTRITHEASVQKNTLEVHVRIDQPADIVKPEMLARVRFLAGSGQATTGSNHTASNPSNGNASHTTADTNNQRPEQAVRIAAGCLDPRGGSNKVWVVRDRRGNRGHLQPVPVTTTASTDDTAGDTNNEHVAVRGALQVGDLLVQRPEQIDGLEAGMAVVFDHSPSTAKNKTASPSHKHTALAQPSPKKAGASWA